MAGMVNFARQLRGPERPAIIDGQFLGQLEPLLDDYFQAVAFSLMASDPNLEAGRDRLRARIQTEALFVRGLGYGDEIDNRLDGFG